jgi:transposase-like protein
MERYSKEYSSKWQSRYSEEFKRFICNEYLNGTLTRREIEVKYNIGNSRITYWLREKGYDYVKTRIVPLPSMKQPTNNLNNKDSKESVSELKKDLQEAQLLAETYRKMIEIAEREFKINIVKKSNTK